MHNFPDRSDFQIRSKQLVKECGARTVVGTNIDNGRIHDGQILACAPSIEQLPSVPKLLSIAQYVELHPVMQQAIEDGGSEIE